MRLTLMLALVAAAALVFVGTAVAIPWPGWTPPKYKRVHTYTDATTVLLQFRRRDRKASVFCEAKRVKRGDRRCTPTGGGTAPGFKPDRRIRVPAWARVYTVLGGTMRSVFRGRTIFYRDLGTTRGNDGSGPLEQNHEAWACTPGRYPVYVHVSASGRPALGPVALARMIWSMHDS